MRPLRDYNPYSMTLQKFTHERYAGTEIAKNFASRVVLSDLERNENRDVLIYMNHPLRYRGETYYQSGFEKNDTACTTRPLLLLTSPASLSQPVSSSSSLITSPDSHAVEKPLTSHETFFSLDYTYSRHNLVRR